MKKYVKLLPVIIYPYAYMICLVLFFISCILLDGKVDDKLVVDLFFYIAGGYNIITIIDAVYNSIFIARNECSSVDVAKINLVMKAVQIPAYIVHFFMGIIGVLMGVWGIGFLLFAIIIDVISIALTGIVSIGCVYRLRKNLELKRSKAVLYTICSFVFCVDVFVAVALLAKAKLDEHDVK